MAANRAISINVEEIAKTVSAAVEQIRSHKELHESLAFGPIVMGRFIRELAPETIGQIQLESVAAEVTTKVNSQVPGLNARSFVGGGLGGTTMGFILREE